MPDQVHCPGCAFHYALPDNADPCPGVKSAYLPPEDVETLRDCMREIQSDPGVVTDMRTVDRLRAMLAKLEAKGP